MDKKLTGMDFQGEMVVRNIPNYINWILRFPEFNQYTKEQLEGMKPYEVLQVWGKIRKLTF
jgi:hypothetical protein